MADVVLAGHSMGGAVSIFASADAPRRVRRLVLLDPVMIPRSRVAATSDTLFSVGRRRPEATRGVSQPGGGARHLSHSKRIQDLVRRNALRLCDRWLSSICRRGEVTLACRPEWESSSFAAQDQDVWGAVARSVCPITVLRAEIDSTCRVETGD